MLNDLKDYLVMMR